MAENMILQNFREPEFSSHGILNKAAIGAHAEKAGSALR